MSQDKQELTSRTLADMLTLIQKREYEPGERLPSERELSERFGVGRAVIREALSILENLRYLKRKPNSGVYLTSMPEQTSLETLGLFSELGLSLASDKLAEALEVRRIIETQAILLACERRTDEDLKLAESIVERFDQAVTDGNVGDLDFEFHMAIFKAAHNTVLTQLVTPFYIMSAARRAIFFSDPERCKNSNEEHRVLLDCLRSRDGMRAQRIMFDHIGRVETKYAELQGNAVSS
ncbi:MAG TPA: FadR/GntR family transcriptional regulator [Burkholderiaceae bacterium]|nr:FadR/GntR family transcriptional regulator [Burkholderiaceae bacterium]